MQHNVHEGRLDGAAGSEVPIGTRSRAWRGRCPGLRPQGEMLGLLPAETPLPPPDSAGTCSTAPWYNLAANG